ncbi:MAG: alpha/beta hydrolase [Oscillospiraceae bacterium]|nr:alpha/beta hydrolase [Oscillospiraceae bacterium]
MTGILIGAGALVLMLAAVCWAYGTAFYAPKKRKDVYDLPKGEQYERHREQMLSLIRKIEALPFERVSITAEDGTRLEGRYYHLRDGAPLQIELHGYRGAGSRDFCGGNALARSMGHNTLVVDQRAHGKSGGHTITFGIREREDCLLWAEYAAKRFGADTPIFLSGVSMGAATVLMAAELPLPNNVCGIVADSPYSSPAAIIRKVCQDAGLPVRLSMALVRVGARTLGRFSLNEADALRAVERTDIPILLIHGEDDRFVPCSMSREIYARCAGPAFLETFPDAGHGLSYMEDPRRYERIVRTFTEYCLDRFEAQR